MNRAVPTRALMTSRLAVLAALALLGAVGCATPRAVAGVPLEPNHVEPELVAVHHKVEPGQTLYRISLAYEISVEELMAANGLSDPRALSVGQELLIPGAERAQPVSLSGAAAAERTPAPAGGGEPKTKGGTERKTSPAAAAKVDPAHAASLSWPLRGVLYGRYGKKGKEAHDGIDLAAPLGTPVKTAAKGLVLYAGTQRGYGNIVLVEHDSGIVTLYAHNRDLRVKTGQTVRDGQVIATVGESGATSGPHLHFEVRKEGLAVDPLPYLGPVPGK